MSFFNKRKTLIIPHIPKCAGSSVLQQLKQKKLNNQINVFYDNDAQPHYREYWNDVCLDRNKDFSLVDFKKFDVISGHFPANRYIGRNYSHVVLLREPIERAISQYFYWKNTMPEDDFISIDRDPIISDIKSGNCSFIDYLKTTKMDGFFHRYLMDLEYCKHLVIFDYNNYVEYIEYIGNYLNVSLDASVKVRVTKEKIQLDKNELEFACDFLKDEVDFYHLLLNNYGQK